MTFEQTIQIALLTVLGGGIASAFVTSVLASRRDRKDYRKKKYEELYGLIAEDSVDFTSWYLGYMAVFEGALPLNQLKRNSSSTGMERKAKALMLAALYADDVTSALESYFQNKKSLISYINEASKKINADVASKIALNDFYALRTNFDEARSGVFTKLISLSKCV